MLSFTGAHSFTVSFTWWLFHLKTWTAAILLWLCADMCLKRKAGFKHKLEFIGQKTPHFNKGRWLLVILQFIKMHDLMRWCHKLQFIATKLSSSCSAAVERCTLVDKCSVHAASHWDQEMNRHPHATWCVCLHNVGGTCREAPGWHTTDAFSSCFFFFFYICCFTGRKLMLAGVLLHFDSFYIQLTWLFK